MARAESERLRAEVARLSANARTRRRRAALRLLSLERDTLLVEKADSREQISCLASGMLPVTRWKKRGHGLRSPLAMCESSVSRRTRLPSWTRHALSRPSGTACASAERDALEESARLVPPAASAGDLAALSMRRSRPSPLRPRLCRTRSCAKTRAAPRGDGDDGRVSRRPPRAAARGNVFGCG